MDNIIIIKEDMDNLLKEDKGWLCNKSGNEYVYDYHLKSYPIIVKVLSSIKVDENRKENKNSWAIRVFAVKTDGDITKPKIVCGLVKAKTVWRTENWKDNLQKAVYSVINSSKVVYDKQRKKR